MLRFRRFTWRTVVGGSQTYTTNETILHSGTRVIPRRQSARGAWNYRIVDCHDPAPTLTMTYDLNRLQRLDEPHHYLVTLICKR